MPYGSDSLTINGSESLAIHGSDSLAIHDSDALAIHGSQSVATDGTIHQQRIRGWYIRVTICSTLRNIKLYNASGG